MDDGTGEVFIVKLGYRASTDTIHKLFVGFRREGGGLFFFCFFFVCVCPCEERQKGKGEGHGRLG